MSACIFTRPRFKKVKNRQWQDLYFVYNSNIINSSYHIYSTMHYLLMVYFRILRALRYNWPLFVERGLSISLIRAQIHLEKPSLTNILYYCCYFQRLKPSNHATIQSLVHAIGINSQVPGPCCVPDKLSAVTLLYFDENKNVVLKNYPEMSVDSCSCR